MQLSAIGRAVLIAREGRRLVAYQDSVGVWTIGIGCTRMAGRPVRKGDRISAAECDALFDETLATFVAALNRLMRAPVTQNAFDALVSIAFNIGIGSSDPRLPGGFTRSTFLRKLNAGEVVAARDAILMWNKPAAIVTRRQAEAQQFVTPYTTALPRATSAQAPVVVPVVATPVPQAPGAPHPAEAAPVIVPVTLPARTGWLARVGAWFDRVWADDAPMPDAARG